MGFSVFKPRCAVPFGKPCIPVEGGGRRLADAGADSSDEICLPFDVQLFEKEEVFFKLDQITVVVVSTGSSGLPRGNGWKLGNSQRCLFPTGEGDAGL
jgi:hypothetical protein